MKRGKCIYCKEYEDLNREHAFPKSLLQKGAPGWTIKKHVCVTCNSKLAQLDAVLIKKSPLAFTWYRIQDELDNQAQTPHSSISHERTFGINPVRQFAPDPLYENYIVLHDIVTKNNSTSVPGDSVLRPQIVLTQYPDSLNSTEIIAANCEKFNNTSLDKDIFTDYGRQQEVYRVLGNTYIFPPKTAEYFFNRIAEFKSKFITDLPHTRYDMMIIFPKEKEQRRVAETFFNSFPGTKEIIDEEQIPSPELAIRIIQVRTDQKAFPDIARAIAKIAFHCFLYHYPDFSGHELIFNNIKEFIYTGSPDRFVTEWKNPSSENIVYDSTTHFHIIFFFLQNDNIGCRIDLFTGLRNPPVSYQIILAGEPDILNYSPSSTEYLPFYVHPRSQMKKRILPVDRFSTIWVAKFKIWTPYLFE